MNNIQFVKKYLEVDSVMGVEWLCLCPYHSDKKPSFCVNVRKSVFVCYACGQKGTIKQLAKYLNSGEEPRELMTTPRELLDKIRSADENVSEAKKTISQDMIDFWQDDSKLTDYWSQRGITDPLIIKQFCLGYDPLSDSLVMPIHSWGTGDISATISRYLNPEAGSPKYKYSKGFKISHHLYGGWQAVAQRHIHDKIAVVEGAIDALSMWEVGIPAVAILGASVSTRQAILLKKIAPTQYILMTDRDVAGRQASLKVESVLMGTGIITSYPNYDYWEDGCKDVADLSPEARKQCFELSTYNNKIDVNG